MLYYTRHARERMIQRGIKEEDVEYCLINYHTSYKDFKGNPIYKADLIDGRCIKVVVDGSSSEPRKIITVAD
jgi:hypothetical protein